MFYIYINDNKIGGKGLCPCINSDIQNIEVTENIYDNIELYIWDGSNIIENPNYAEEEKQKEAERIAHLTCTKRVLALCLEEYGITYPQLKELIATEPRALLEWELCERLERNNPLLDLMGAKLGITPEQIDSIFLFANGEIEQIK